MNKLIDFIIEKPKLTLVFFFAVNLAFIFGLTRLKTSNNQDSELPEEDSVVKTIHRLEDKFGKKDFVLIGIESENIFTPPTLKKVANITEDLKGIDGIIENEIISLVTTNNITHKDWGLKIAPFVDSIPKTQELCDELKKSILNNDIANQVVVSKDGTFTAVIANITDGYDEKSVYNKVSAIAKKYSNPENIFYAGDPIQQQEIDRGVKADLSFLIPLALILVIIGLYFAFRTIKGILLPLAVILLTIIWTLGFMGLVGLNITVVSSLVPILTIVVSSSYGIHVTYSYMEEEKKLDHKSTVKNAVKRIAPAILMTGFTSAIGAASLLIFKVRSIREFGLITSVGMISAVIISIFFVSAILSLQQDKRKSFRKQRYSRDILGRILLSISNFSTVNYKGVLISSIIIVAIAIVGIMKVEVGNDISKYFPKEHRLSKTFNKFNDKLGGARVLDIAITGNEVDAIKNPELLTKIANLQSYAESLQGVGSSYSIADIIKRMNQEFNNGDSNFNMIPESKDLVAQLLFLYSISDDPEKLSDLIDSDCQSAKIRLMLRTSEQKDHMRIYKEIQKYVTKEFGNDASMEMGGDIMFWLAQIKYIVTGKIFNILLSIVLVIVFCIIIFRSIIIGIYSAIPLTLSSLLTFGTMGFLGIRLDIATAVITSIGIGIGVDFAIHFISRYKQEVKNPDGDAMSNTMSHTGKAIIYDVTSNLISFSVFVFSGFMPVRYFGSLIALTMLTMVICTLFIFPAIFRLYNPYEKMNKKTAKNSISYRAA